VRVLISAVALLLVAPLLLVDVPPLLDYPNHLARLFLLARGAADPVLAPMFVANWAIIPDLGIDLVGVPLLWLLPPHVGGRVLLAIVLLLPFAGVLALNRALFGRVQPWALASALVLPAGAFLLGFLNFVAGLGGALLLAAFWIAQSPSHPRRTLVLAMVGMVALFFCHLMGVLFALGLIAAWEGLAWRRLGRVALIALPPLALYLMAPLHGVAGDPVFLPPRAKLAQLMAAFTAYDARLDWLTALATGAFLLACAIARRLDIPPGMRRALAGAVLLYAASPYAFKGTQSLDTRFVFLLALLAFAAVRPGRLPGWAAPGVATLFTLLLLLRTASLALAWHAQIAELAAFRAVIAPVRPGEKVFIIAVRPEEAPQYWRGVPPNRRFADGTPTDTQLPALLLIERRAFFPLLFDRPSQQPILLTPEYRRLAERNEGVIPHLTLRPESLCGFDTMLLLDAGALRPGELPSDWLVPIVVRDEAALYRITPPAGSGCAKPG
jgi:hypothetical protein